MLLHWNPQLKINCLIDANDVACETNFHANWVWPNTKDQISRDHFVLEWTLYADRLREQVGKTNENRMHVNKVEDIV